MSVRYQADADLNQDIVRALRRCEPGLDIRTATESNLEGVEDLDVLAMAARDGIPREP